MILFPWQYGFTQASSSILYKFFSWTFSLSRAEDNTEYTVTQKAIFFHFCLNLNKSGLMIMYIC